MQGDLAGIGVDEIPLRQQVEMRRDLILADAGNLFRDELAVSHFEAGVEAGFERFTVDQAFEGGAEEGSMEGIFVSIP